MIDDPFDLGLGPGDRDPIIIRVKEKLGVFPSPMSTRMSWLPV